MPQSVATAKMDMEIRTITPSPDRVVVEPDYLKAGTTKIIIPASAKERYQATTGEIKAVGESSNGMPFPFKVGDKVVFTRYAGVEITLTKDDKEKRFMILNFLDVLCSVSEDE